MSELIRQASAQLINDMLEDFTPTICSIMAAGVPASDFESMTLEVFAAGEVPLIIPDVTFKAQN